MTKTHGLHIEKKKEYIRIRLPNLIKKENILSIENRIESSIIGYNGKVVLDLSDILNMYSILVTLIMHVEKQVTKSGGIFYLANVSKKCKLQLELMNLDKILKIYENDVHIK